MRLNPKHQVRTDMDSALAQIELLDEQHQDMANGFYAPPSLFEVFKRHALLIVGGSLFGSALLYLAAFVRHIGR